LDKILAQHKLWAESDGKSGVRADLSGARLLGAQLVQAHLNGANLIGANLIGADLSDAGLSRADLTGANLFDAHLTGAYLDGAHLPGAILDQAHLPGANLFDAYLTGADLAGTDLASAHLDGAHLNSAHLTNAHLPGAQLYRTDLTSAYLFGTDVAGAHLLGADLSGTNFEPKNLPVLEDIALARGLELMTYSLNPGPLTQLRKRFQDAGYREQERAITYALNRHDAQPAELRSSVEATFRKILRRPHEGDYAMPLGSFIEAAFKWVAFDLTCQYGLTPGRPLRLVLWLWLFFSIGYAVFMHWPGPSGIYFIGSRTWRGKSNSQGIQIRPRAIRASKWWKLPYVWLRREWRVLRAAMFFSLMSAFNIGFRDINFGRWLRLLTKREYDLKAVGWARTVSGFQSLLSVYLIALWVLTYFGRPFG
jgi:uncharacterized protein YjbI with pentapeptide repeats